jgi:ribosomal 50S subunit-recycling heat shock protein
VRLDLFLKASRLCPRRSVAQTLCDEKLVLLNDRVAKSSHSVKPGDEITIRRRNRETKVKVLSVPTTRQVSRAEAPTTYELMHEISIAEDQ